MPPKRKPSTSTASTPKPLPKAPLPPPRKWAKAHPRFIVPELRRRQLPTWGSPSTLITRLKATDAPSLRTPESRLTTHKKALKRLQTSSLKHMIPFHHFNKLPLEIRERVWEFALPGPRVLTLDTSRNLGVSERLIFSSVFKAKNPAALSTCKEARAVALRRYRLAFGTSNVYFDFKGGDILYFGPECFHGTFLDQEWGWTTSTYVGPNEPSRAVKVCLAERVRRDLEAVRHLAISRGLWENHRERYAWFEYQRVLGWDNCCGELLRKRLRKFESVERISLEHGRQRVEHPEGHEVYCGGPVIEDPWFEERPFDWRTMNARETLHVKMYKEHVPWLEEWLEMDGKWEVTGDLSAVALLSRWDAKDLSEEEKEKGVPEARLVDIKFVPDEPKRIREELWRHRWAEILGD
jgi:hypothetical protein